MERSSRLAWAVKIAKEAGDFTLKYFDQPQLAIERKGDGTPVTAADRGAEKLLRERIASEFPNDAILGEELPSKDGTSGFRWILDPIDGTKSFIHGVPIYSTLIGVERTAVNESDSHRAEGETVLGVIWIPALSCGVWAEKGCGAFEESPQFEGPRRAQVSEVDSLAEACFLTSEVKTFDETGRRAVYDLMEERSRLTRTWGDAYGYYLIATGRADFMVDPEMCSWDAGPLLTILTEAGGRFTDWQGHATIYGGEGVGSNARLFDEIISITKRYPKKHRRN